MHEDIGSMGEFALIDIFRTRAGTGPSLGIGDDCAILETSTEGDVLVTTDALVEKVHFLRDRITARQLGYKSLAASISDIAAMGGKPTAAFLSLGLTRDLNRTWVESFADGFMECAHAFGVDLLGGDTVACRQEMFINVTLMGLCEPGRAIRRHGAKEGDCIYIGRTTGDSAAGLVLLMHDEPDLDEQGKRFLLDAHLLPDPQVGLGLELARGWANAMIDISDGLVQDLGHICRASALGARLYLDSVPISAPAAKLAEITGKSALDWALGGGEDYCLLFCIHPDDGARLEARCLKELQTRIYKIGTMVQGEKVKAFKANRQLEMKVAGFDHFSGNRLD